MPGPAAESLAAVPALLAGLDDAGLRMEWPAAPEGADLRTEWLAALAAGDLIATPAAPPRLPFAADAEAAGLVLLAKAGVVRVAATGAVHRSVDAARSLSKVTGHGVVARGTDAAVARALDMGALACSAQLLGAGRALLEASVRHAELRHHGRIPRPGGRAAGRRSRPPRGR